MLAISGRTDTSRCAPQFKTVKPVGDRVFVKMDKAEVKSIGGVLLPSASRTNSTAGTVVALGDSKNLKVSVCWLLRHALQAADAGPGT